ncbi:hypothetical protein EUTSA_v10028898mg [Eutrema salsugineum]|uniref:EF-hand domain-containing protein n=1 Tax=Eutrema salsugineum TaxID=72664 RepID=V4L1Z8_EUTSA|nr:caltractin isoform X2 [Eutrema salsugineum]ESQ37664.1 hypothetical protein EUTSA_v10028898mg [Eutrema salsugineum]
MSGGEGSESESESESEERVKYEPKGKVSEYEKQRFSRIAENKARLEALGISKAARAIMGSRKRRGKPNSDEEDDDYRPGEAAGDEEEEFEDSEYDEEDEGNSSSVSRKTKSKKRVLSLNRSGRIREDDDLKKAIALSLQDSEAAAAGGSRNSPAKKRRSHQEATSWNKNKPELMMSKMQMTEDEFVIYFYHFDEAGKGFITLRDVTKMATVHDFTWTDEELQDMIRCFDMDKDGKLSLDEFRKIVTRCRMLKES